MVAYEDMLKLEGSCQQLQLSLFIRDVNYSCGSCGYELNLNSSNRNTSFIDSKYGKSLKRGIISFFSVDETRFNQLQQLPWSLSWIPFFNSNRLWGLSLFQRTRRRTKLLCRKCGTHLGYAYAVPSHSQSQSHSWDGISDSRIYDIKLTTLQPSFYDHPSQRSQDMDMGMCQGASSNSIMKPRIDVV